MEVKAVLIYSHKAGFQRQLESELKEAGIDLIGDEMFDFSWRRRMIRNKEIAKEFPDDLLIFLDAWDTLLLGTKQEILDLNLHEGVTFAAGKICWPDRDRESDYKRRNPYEKSPWRYINSNPMAGLGKNIYRAINWGWKKFPLKEDTVLIQAHDVCERFLTELYFKAPGRFGLKLDTECRLAQLYRKSLPGDLYLTDDKRIVNMFHRTKPIFLHANGRTIVPDELIT